MRGSAPDVHDSCQNATIKVIMTVTVPYCSTAVMLRVIALYVVIDFNIL